MARPLIILFVCGILGCGVMTRALPNSDITKFNGYRALNEDFVGWLKVEGTTIDSPLVQGEDNEHYLKFNYKNQRASRGAIYMDYRNRGNFYDRHIAIYGHYMKNGSIFHDLHNFKDKGFFDAHDTITLAFEREERSFQIISAQIVDADTYYLMMDLKGETLMRYIKTLNANSLFKRDLNLPKGAAAQDEVKLLTLVTCTYEEDNHRLLIHAIQK